MCPSGVIYEQPPFPNELAAFPDVFAQLPQAEGTARNTEPQAEASRIHLVQTDAQMGVSISRGPQKGWPQASKGLSARFGAKDPMDSRGNLPGPRPLCACEHPLAELPLTALPRQKT